MSEQKKLQWEKAPREQTWDTDREETTKSLKDLGWFSSASWHETQLNASRCSCVPWDLWVAPFPFCSFDVSYLLGLCSYNLEKKNRVPYRIWWIIVLQTIYNGNLPLYSASWIAWPLWPISWAFYPHFVAFLVDKNYTEKKVFELKSHCFNLSKYCL